MHSRVLHISRFDDNSAQPEVHQSVVAFSRRWATATTPTGVLRRHPTTNRWSHGGGLFVDVASGTRFVMQSLWPIVDEPELRAAGALSDSSSGFSWTAPRMTTDPAAAERIERLERAERRRLTRERLRPKARGEGRLVIRLMVEYGVDWPLWGDDGPMEPWELGLSRGLTARLREWNDLWETGFHYESGWKEAGDRRRFVHDERLLAAALFDEVRAFADVEVAGWSTES